MVREIPLAPRRREAEVHAANLWALKRAEAKRAADMASVIDRLAGCY